MVTFSDEEIGELIAVAKVGVAKRPGLPSLRRKRGHVETHAGFKGKDGSEFRVVLRRSSASQMAFSAILMVRVQRSNRWFRRRVDHPTHPLVVFGLVGDGRTRDATIALLQYEKWGLHLRSLAVFEDQQTIGRNVLARLTDMCDRQYSSLGGNRNRIVRFLNAAVTT